MLKLIYGINIYNEEEQGLYDENADLVIMSGDYYHTKISDRIKGFLDGLEYANIRKEVKVLVIGKESELFKKFGFVDEM